MKEMSAYYQDPRLHASDNLPEVVPNQYNVPQDFPEVAPDQYAYPEKVPDIDKFGGGLHDPGTAGLEPVPTSQDHMKRGQPETTASDPAPFYVPPSTKWWKTRKGKLALIAAALVLFAVILGVSLGVALGQKKHSTQHTSPSSTAPSTSATPTSVSPASVCRSTICPSMIAVVQDSSPSASPDARLVFGLGADSAVWYRQWDGSNWQNAWTSLGGSFASQPGAVTFESDQTNVWVIEKGLAMSSIAYKDGSWDSSWRSLGGGISSPPSTCSHSPGELDIFVRGTDGSLYQMNWNTDSNAYSQWMRLQGFLSSSPTVGCAAPDRIDVVVYGGSNPPHDFWVLRWIASGWGGWENQGGDFKGDPTAISRSSNSSDYFGIATDGSMHHLSWSSSDGYGSWDNLGGNFESMPHAIAVSDSRIDVLAIGTNDHLMHKAYTNSTWSSDWDDLGGSFNSAPVATLDSSGNVTVFGFNHDGHVFHGSWMIGADAKWSDGTGWTDDGGNFTLNWFRPGPIS